MERRVEVLTLLEVKLQVDMDLGGSSYEELFEPLSVILDNFGALLPLAEHLQQPNLNHAIHVLQELV